MNRRTFVKALGYGGALLLTSNRSSARSLYLLGAGQPARVSKIEWIVYDTGRRQESGRSTHRCAVRLTTRNGVQGWADVSGSIAPDSDASRLIRGVLLGRNVAEHDAIWRGLYEQGLPLATLGAVDIALWDLRGRMAGKSVHALLGTERQKVKTYLTTDFNLGDPAQYAEYALACKEKGLHGCKIHPYVERGAGRNGLADAGFPDRDMAVYQAVRDAVGTGYPCMADNHGTYAYDEALRVGRLLDDLEYAWYESPMPERDEWLDRYVALAKEIRTPVCAPQAHPDSYQSRTTWVTAGACDVCRIDVHRGGFTACLELALACEAAGIPLELHGVGLDAYPHLQLIGATAESLIEYLETHSLSQESMLRPGRATPEPVFDGQGYVSIPQTPGMGLELDWTYIFAHRVMSA